MKNLPNLLTFLRLAAAPLVGLVLALVAFGKVEAATWLPVSLALFTVACLTDVFDGLLARRFDLESVLGAVLDPVADKLLILSTGLGLVLLIPSVWVFVPILIMLGRDVLVSGLREAALTQNWRLEVRGLGKLKTILQCVAFALVLAELSFTALGLRAAPSTLASPMTTAALWLAAAVSAISALDYTRAFLKHR